MSEINCHIPISLRVTGELSDATRERLEGELARTLARRVHAAARTITAGLGRQHPERRVERGREPFALERKEVESGTYQLPSYDEGGTPTQLPIEETSRQVWTIDRLGAHI